MSAGVRIGRMAVAADLVLAAALAGFMVVASNRPDAIPSSDAVPRPLAILALYATPGVIGAIGTARRRRSLLVGAAVVLVPGALLSMAGATLMFVLPMVLFALSAASMPASTSGRLVELAEAIIVTGVVLAAGFALLAVTENTCVTDSSASSCGSAALTVQGVAAELGLLLAAIAFAAWRTGGRRARAQGTAS